MEFTEGLRKVFLAGVGAVASTAENAKELIDDLVEKGELTVAQGRMLNEELKHTAKEKVKEHICHRYQELYRCHEFCRSDDRRGIKRSERKDCPDRRSKKRTA